MLENVKMILGLVVTCGIGSIMGNIVRRTTPKDIGILNKICITIGGLVLGSMVCDSAGKYVDNQIDEVVRDIRDVKS